MEKLFKWLPPWIRRKRSSLDCDESFIHYLSSSLTCARVCDEREMRKKQALPTRTSKAVHGNCIDNPNGSEAKTFVFVVSWRVLYPAHFQGTLRWFLAFRTRASLHCQLIMQMPRHLWISAWAIAKECIPFDWYDWVWQFSKLLSMKRRSTHFYA